MRLYESVIIARQDVSSGHVEELLNEFCAIIENDHRNRACNAC